MKKLLVLLLGVVSFALYATPAFATGGDPQSPGMGWIEICKASNGNPSLVDTFMFSLNVAAKDAAGKPVTSISAPVGACTEALQVPAGQVTVTEIPVMTDGPSFDPLHSTVGQFSSFDYTAVTAIHTSAPGALDAQLVSKSLGGRTATVVVNKSDFQTDETMVTFTNDPVQGYIEVCKSQTDGAGLDNMSFPFTIYGGNDFQWSGSITTGACSDPILVPSGHVFVQETGTQYVAGITSHDTSSLTVRAGQTSTDVTDPMQVASGWASVEVLKNGTMSQDARVTFENNMSQLKICKVADSPELVGETYNFMVNASKAVSVVADAPGSTGHCVVVGPYPAGTAMVVSEAPTPGETVASIGLSDGRLVTQTGTDFTGISASFNMAAGVETITFHNATDPGGWLKVCKNGPAGEPAATFDVTGPRGVAPDTVTDTDTLVVPVGQCVLVPAPKLPYAGLQTITEHAQAGYAVSTATVADASLAGPALSGSSIGAYVGNGLTTIVTFTNVAAVAAPVTTDDPPAPATVSAPAGSSSPAAPAAPAVSAAPPAQAPAPAVISPAVTKTKAVVKSTLSSSMIKNHRVIVRVVGSASKATIRVTLYNAHHKVLRSVLRSVPTNRATVVPNLKLGPAVKHFKVKVL